ncbi:MAG TPA: hypothetical protein VN038_01280 [Dyadobacter sp.]|nr:hypothetical protein [Dyadobacter sp.]
MKTAFGLEGNVLLNIFDSQSGKLLHTQEQHNLVVSGGLGAMLRVMNEPYGARTVFDSVRFNDTTAGAPAWGDTTVEAGYLEKPITAVDTLFGPTPADGVSDKSHFELLAAEYNGNNINELSLWVRTIYLEVGVPDEVILFSRVKIAPIAKTSSIRIEGTWEIKCSVVVV